VWLAASHVGVGWGTRQIPHRTTCQAIDLIRHHPTTYVCLFPTLAHKWYKDKMSTPIEKHDTQIIEPDTKGDTAKAEIFLADAQAGNDSEVKMGLFAALKLYPKASAWSIAISLAVVMEGMSSIELLTLT
jgi:hypothetical protein